MNIIFEFVGGPFDGKTVTGGLGQGGDAERYYLLTNHGAVGQRFKAASDYAIEALTNATPDPTTSFQTHYYVVVDRLQGDAEVLVRAEYRNE